MPTPQLTNDILTAAILGFEQQKRQIDTKIGELRALLAGGSSEAAVTPEAAPRKRSKFSAATRRKMALAQKARWAKVRGESEPTQAAAPPTKPKRKVTAAARAKLVANLKKARAAKAAKAKAAAKKTAPARKKTTAKKVTVKAPAKAKAAKRAPVKKAAVKKSAAEKAAAKKPQKKAAKVPSQPVAKGVVQ